MATSTNRSAKDSEQPTKPPTRFTTNPPTDDAVDDRALEAHRIEFYFDRNTAGLSRDRGETRETAGAHHFPELDADLVAAVGGTANAPAGGPPDPDNLAVDGSPPG